MTSGLFLFLPSLLTGCLRKAWKATAILDYFLEAFSTPSAFGPSETILPGPLDARL